MIDPRQWYVDQLDVINRIASSICRRNGVQGADAEDFVSDVRLKLLQDDYAVLRKAGTGDMVVTSESLDDKTWIAQYTPTDGARSWVRYDRATKKVTPLFVDRPDLEGKKLAKLQPKILKARDGLELVSYLTLPASEAGAKPAKPLPLVLLVHGGPWARDALGYNATHQWLANRGYAVLSVNFRGSVGFGKEFLNAGDLQWGRKMHDDLLDAVEWAIGRGVAAREKVAITAATLVSAMTGTAFPI